MISSDNKNTASHPAVQLFLVSVVMLFTEIALIRWLSTEARIFAYVNNLVLLSCFLGIGMGCYYSSRKVIFSLAPLSLAALIAMIKLPLVITVQGQDLHLFKDVPVLLSAFTDSVVWYETTGGITTLMTIMGMASTLVLFSAVLVVFIPLGQMLGRLLDDHRNTIVAYSINVAASMVGVWLFGAFSLIYLPPWSWFAAVVIGLLLILLFQTDRCRRSYVSIIIFTIAVSSIALLPDKDDDQVSTMWSPYQKLELHQMEKSATGVSRGYLLNVNNVGYMTMLDLSDRFMTSFPGIFDLDDRSLSQYDLPYRFRSNVKNALILGAGAGNDAAGALRNGVEAIDAIEIDPGIYRLGSKYHPEQPYSDPRVSVIIDDARSYLKSTSQTYDVISFGLLDAHTLSSAYNNMRIDHYVYTLESIQEARERLRDDGVLTMSFEAQRPWIIRRLHDLLTEAFGHEPIAFTHRFGQGRYGWGGTMFVTSRNMDIIHEAMKNDRSLSQFIEARKINFPGAQDDSAPIRPTTDDWPYLYLQTPSIPNMHLCVMVVLGLLIVLVGRTVLAKGSGLNLHFFFLGAAFLLLEFQNISKSSLLFGSTWMVNSIIISAILTLALLANLFVARVRLKSLKPIYIMLIAISLATYFIPLSLFNSLGYWTKAFVVTGILNLPVFFGGIVFIESLRKTPRKDVAFGSNLLGAAVGGILESMSFILGINALLLLVVVFYVLSFVFMKRGQDQAV
jgi:hypothetical protein